MDEITMVLGGPDKIDNSGTVTGYYYAIARVLEGEARRNIRREAVQIMSNIQRTSRRVHSFAEIFALNPSLATW